MDVFVVFLLMAAAVAAFWFGVPLLSTLSPRSIPDLLHPEHCYCDECLDEHNRRRGL